MQLRKTPHSDVKCAVFQAGHLKKAAWTKIVFEENSLLASGYVVGSLTMQRHLYMHREVKAAHCNSNSAKSCPVFSKKLFTVKHQALFSCQWVKEFSSSSPPLTG